MKCVNLVMNIILILMARKADLLDEINMITEGDDKEQIFEYLFNHFNSQDLFELIEFIKEEKGI
jgi:hypothetical protein